MSLTAKAPTSKKSAQLALDAQPEPVQPRLLSAEPTIEGLVKSLCHGLPSMGLFSDEGGQFLGGSTMSKDNMIKAITHLSTLWDGSPIDRSRAMAGESLRAYDRRLSMHLMLQPRLADRLLQDSDIKDQGILGRCLISWPERLVGQRPYKAIDLTRDPKVHLYQQRIAALMQKPWSRHKDGGLNPVTLELSPRAREASIAIHDTIECESGEFGELVNVQAAAGKAAANVLRMAGVMAVVEESTVLEEMHIQRASTLMDYYLAENQRLAEQEPLNKLRAEADCLLRWLIKKNWPPFRLRDITRNGPRFARKSTRHTFELLLQLVTHNWLNNAGDIFEVRRLNDAVRRYRAQHRSPTELRCVAATATTLSPSANPDAAGLVASVAAVAAPTSESTDLARLIEQLQEEGALLQRSEDALLIRPAHWGQLDSIGPHWKALLLLIQTNDQCEDNGAGRSA